jgi:hypothetical protein
VCGTQALPDVQVRGRLVKHVDVRILHGNHGDGEALQFAARQDFDFSVEQMVQLKGSQGRAKVCGRARVFSGSGGDLGPERKQHTHLQLDEKPVGDPSFIFALDERAHCPLHGLGNVVDVPGRVGGREVQ